MRPIATVACRCSGGLCRKKRAAGLSDAHPGSAEMVRKLADAAPDRSFCLVADIAYINATLLGDRPENVEVIGPLHWKAALFERPGPYSGKGTAAQEGPAAAGASGDDRGHGELSGRGTWRSTFPKVIAETPGAGDPRRPVVPRVQGSTGDGGAGPRPGGGLAGRGAAGDRPERGGDVRDHAGTAGDGAWSWRSSTASSSSGFTTRGCGVSGAWSGHTRWPCSWGRWWCSGTA